MAVSNVIERLGRAIFEAPFGTHKIAKDAPELAEIRIAVLDAVKAKSHRASGKSIFPYDLVRIHLRGVPDEQASVFGGEFLATYFAEELRSGLARSNYRFPTALRVEISTTSKLPEPNEDWLSVDTRLIEPPQATQPPVAARQPASLLVMTGTANQTELKLEKNRINIGRTADVYHSAAGPSRRNDLAFAEDSEINRSVSREHAHVLYSPKTGEYRILNDRVYKGASNCGIWIVRDGLSQPVHRSNRGTVLEPGDEIHLGQAVMRFQMG
jgi:hypothetical protein